MLSGLVDSYDPRHLERIEQELAQYGGNKEIIPVQCYILNDVLKQHDITYVDYLSIDTEGSEFEIIKSIDFDSVSIAIIGVENNYKEPLIRNFLVSKGYQYITKIGGDEIYKKRS